MLSHKSKFVWQHWAHMLILLTNVTEWVLCLLNASLTVLTCKNGPYNVLSTVSTCSLSDCCCQLESDCRAGQGGEGCLLSRCQSGPCLVDDALIVRLQVTFRTGHNSSNTDVSAHFQKNTHISDKKGQPYSPAALLTVTCQTIIFGEFPLECLLQVVLSKYCQFQ